MTGEEDPFAGVVVFAAADGDGVLVGSVVDFVVGVVVVFGVVVGVFVVGLVGVVDLTVGFVVDNLCATDEVGNLAFLSSINFPIDDEMV